MNFTQFVTLKNFRLSALWSERGNNNIVMIIILLLSLLLLFFIIEHESVNHLDTTTRQNLGEVENSKNFRQKLTSH